MEVVEKPAETPSPQKTTASAGLSRKYLKALECSYCGKQFPSRRELLVHQYSHKERQSYDCTVCDKSFNREQLFRKHMASHVKNESRLAHCDICGKAFRTSRLLEQHHLKEHAGEKPFKCTTCGISFSWRHNLTKHEHIHVEKPFACLICHEAFRDAASLEFHLRMHKSTDKQSMKGKDGAESQDDSVSDGEFKPFQCKVCQQEFKYQFTLDAHMKGHGDVTNTGGNGGNVPAHLQKPHTCEKCGESFRWSFCLDAHVKIHSQQQRKDGMVFYQGVKVPKPVSLKKNGVTYRPKYLPEALQRVPASKSLNNTKVYNISVKKPVVTSGSTAQLTTIGKVAKSGVKTVTMVAKAVSSAPRPVLRPSPAVAASAKALLAAGEGTVTVSSITAITPIPAAVQATASIPVSAASTPEPHQVSSQLTPLTTDTPSLISLPPSSPVTMQLPTQSEAPLSHPIIVAPQVSMAQIPLASPVSLSDPQLVSQVSSAMSSAVLVSSQPPLITTASNAVLCQSEIARCSMLLNTVSELDPCQTADFHPSISYFTTDIHQLLSQEDMSDQQPDPQDTHKIQTIVEQLKMVDVASRANVGVGQAISTDTGLDLVLQDFQQEAAATMATQGTKPLPDLAHMAELTNTLQADPSVDTVQMADPSVDTVQMEAITHALTVHQPAHSTAMGQMLQGSVMPSPAADSISASIHEQLMPAPGQDHVANSVHSQLLATSEHLVASSHTQLLAAPNQIGECIQLHLLPSSVPNHVVDNVPAELLSSSAPEHIADALNPSLDSSSPPNHVEDNNQLLPNQVPHMSTIVHPQLQPHLLVQEAPSDSPLLVAATTADDLVASSCHPSMEPVHLEAAQPMLPTSPVQDAPDAPAVSPDLVEEENIEQPSAPVANLDKVSSPVLNKVLSEPLSEQDLNIAAAPAPALGSILSPGEEQQEHGAPEEEDASVTAKKKKARMIRVEQVALEGRKKGTVVTDLNQDTEEKGEKTKKKRGRPKKTDSQTGEEKTVPPCKKSEAVIPENLSANSTPELPVAENEAILDYNPPKGANQRVTKSPESDLPSITPSPVELASPDAPHSQPCEATDLIQVSSKKKGKSRSKNKSGKADIASAQPAVIESSVTETAVSEHTQPNDLIEEVSSRTANDLIEEVSSRKKGRNKSKNKSARSHEPSMVEPSVMELPVPIASESNDIVEDVSSKKKGKSRSKKKTAKSDLASHQPPMVEPPVTETPVCIPSESKDLVERVSSKKKGKNKSKNKSGKADIASLEPPSIEPSVTETPIFDQTESNDMIEEVSLKKKGKSKSKNKSGKADIASLEPPSIESSVTETPISDQTESNDMIEEVSLKRKGRNKSKNKSGKADIASLEPPSIESSLTGTPISDQTESNDMLEEVSLKKKGRNKSKNKSGKADIASLEPPSIDSSMTETPISDYTESNDLIEEVSLKKKGKNKSKNKSGKADIASAEPSVVEAFVTDIPVVDPSETNELVDEPPSKKKGRNRSKKRSTKSVIASLQPTSIEPSVTETPVPLPSESNDLLEDVSLKRKSKAKNRNKSGKSGISPLEPPSIEPHLSDPIESQEILGDVSSKKKGKNKIKNKSVKSNIAALHPSSEEPPISEMLQSDPSDSNNSTQQVSSKQDNNKTEDSLHKKRRGRPRKIPENVSETVLENGILEFDSESEPPPNKRRRGRSRSTAQTIAAVKVPVLPCDGDQSKFQESNMELEQTVPDPVHSDDFEGDLDMTLNANLTAADLDLDKYDPLPATDSLNDALQQKTSNLNILDITEGLEADIKADDEASASTDHVNNLGDMTAETVSPACASTPAKPVTRGRGRPRRSKKPTRRSTLAQPISEPESTENVIAPSKETSPVPAEQRLGAGSEPNDVSLDRMSRLQAALSETAASPASPWTPALEPEVKAGLPSPWTDMAKSEDSCDTASSQVESQQSSPQPASGPRLSFTLYTCEVCNKAFTRRAALVAHKVYHHSRRRHYLEPEAIAVRMAMRLRRRMVAIHTTRKPYSCIECHKRFVHHGYLTFHEEGHDNITRTYFCHHCDLTMTSWLQCIHHQMNHRKGLL